MSKMRLPTDQKVYLVLVASASAGTFATFVTGIQPGIIAPVLSALIILVGNFAVFRAAASAIGKVHAVQGLGAVLTVGILSELLGLYTGFPFGTYRYNEAWAPVLPMPGNHFFPLMLPLAWTMVVGAASLSASRAAEPFSRRAWLISVLSVALLATAVDFAMEPVMVDALGYWTWRGPTHGFSAPWQNAVGWFFVSAIGCLPLTARLAGAKNKIESGAGTLVLAGHLVVMSAVAATHTHVGNSRMTLVGVAVLSYLWISQAMKGLLQRKKSEVPVG
ncbi:MAG: carotenoid biosynthesis protein [Armatimonadetes bacterium]|nr:carotenoid biosynthesis protein [Armatimonadota bacterium]